MRTVFDVLLLILGFVVLIQSAKIFVDASVGIARWLKIPSLVIGLTVVAMGTSAPEAVIGISAAIRGSGELAIANSVGADIFNILFIIGFCAIFFPISVKLKEIARDYWAAVSSIVFLLVMVIVFDGVIPRWGSFALLAGFVAYMIVVVRTAMRKRAENNGKKDTAESETKSRPLWMNILFVILGAGLIVFGGHITVASAVNIALTIGVTERVIGLTIVAMGTSLPELVTTLIACRKGEGEFAVGFIIGSSIFNIMFVLGIAGLISPLAFDNSVIFDTAVLLASAVVLFLFAKSNNRIIRGEGLAMTAMYLTYMMWVILA